MPDQICVRFAPSPTSYPHVGGVRTELFNYLFARRYGDVFILRIEDTDRTRYQPDALANIYINLQWLGLQWHEGPEIGGSVRPYLQSDCTNLYHNALAELLAAGNAYPCIFPTERLEKIRKEQEAAKAASVTGYNRHYRSLNPDESARREKMIAAFSIEKISPKAAVLDEKKLEWMNGLYMQERGVDDILSMALPIWKAKGLADETTNLAYLRTTVRLLKDRSKRITNLAEAARCFFADPTSYDPQAAKKHFTGDAIALLRGVRDALAGITAFDCATIESLYQTQAEAVGVAPGKLIHPTRLAISGVSMGPRLFELMEALGKARVLRRINSAITWIENQ